MMPADVRARKLDLRSLGDLSQLAETVTLECKLAQGEDGQGALPKDFWPSYSAMANSHGGWVLLGVRERHGRFSVAGVPDADKVRRDLCNNLNNPGALRIPAEQALHGGVSDCRNRTLQQMFLMLNLGERAGSGLPRIRAGWEAGSRTLTLHDDFEPYDHTVLTMNWGPSRAAASKGQAETPGETPDLVLRALKADPHATVPTLALQLGKSESAILRVIRKLREGDRLRRIGPDKGGHWEVVV